MIPSTAHFVWYGTRLAYLYALAVRSAATHGGFEAVRLHHADPLDEEPHVRALRELPNVEFVALDDQRLCDEVVGPKLADLSRELVSPAARSNVARMALLIRDGGVYLDTDTLTVRPFDEVRGASNAFIGQERIVFPGHVVRSRDPRVKAKAYAMTALRDVYRRIPHGYRAFQRIEPHYHLAVNNAVIGSAPGHPFVRACVDEMVRMPAERRLRRYALGPHLLQAMVSEGKVDDLRLCMPEQFYPLAPEISAHWFRDYPGGADGRKVVGPTTCCVHWYASVRTKKVVAQISTDDDIRRLAATQLYSSLARRVIDGESVGA
ncbi:MAG: glycosyltransferase [Polyangiales bacterium]